MAQEKLIRLLVADDHPIFREGVVSMLSSAEGMLVVAQAENGRDAIESYRTHLPDAVLLDISMPGLDGVAVIVELRRHWPESKIIVLTSLSGDAIALRAIKAGAQAYLVKTAIRHELVTAIETVVAGGKYLPESVARDIAFHTADEGLTSREIAVLEQVAKWGSNKRVASLLGLSEGTVKVHMKSVLSKLHASDRTQAVAIAIRRGIITS